MCVNRQKKQKKKRRKEEKKKNEEKGVKNISEARKSITLFLCDNLLFLTCFP
jgi:hypothetical protein